MTGASRFAKFCTIRLVFVCVFLRKNGKKELSVSFLRIGMFAGIVTLPVYVNFSVRNFLESNCTILQAKRSIMETIHSTSDTKDFLEAVFQINIL